MRFNDFNITDPVKELADKLPKLHKTDYDTIDELMQRISRRYKMTGQKLHDLFVKKYGHTPDTWVKKIKQRNEEVTEQSGTEYLLFINGKPAAKYTDPQKAEADVQHLQRKFPNKQIEIKQEVCKLEPITAKTTFKESSPKKKDEHKIPEIEKFIKWSIKKLNLQQPLPKFEFSTDTAAAQKGHHTGVHTAEDNKIWVYIGNRNLVDILRTVFHELVHERQTQLNMIKPGDSYPGSPIEAMADMIAGKYIKIYGKKHPEIFE